MRQRNLSLMGVLLVMAPAASGFAPAPGETPSELRAIPAGTFLAVRVNVSDVMKCELARGLSPLLAVVCEHELGVPLDRLESLTYLGFKEGAVWLAATRLPLDRIAVLQTMAPGTGEYSYKGRTFHAHPYHERQKGPKTVPLPREPAREAGADSESPAVGFLNDRIQVRGQARAVLHFLLEANARAEPHPLATALAVAGQHHLTACFSSPSEAQGGPPTETPSFDPLDWRDPLGIGQETLTRAFTPVLSARRGLLTADLGEESRFDVSLTFLDARSARLGVDGMRVALLMARGMLNRFEEQLPDPLAPLKPGSALLAFTNRLRTGLGEATLKVEGSTIKGIGRAKTPPSAVKAVLAETGSAIHLLAHRAVAQHNLRQLALAVIQYSDEREGIMPQSIVYSKDGKPLYSWRVLVLPHLGYKDLHAKLKLDEPWDSRHNKPLLEKMPKVFEMPGVKMPESKTYFQVFEGSETLSSNKKKTRYPASFDNGTWQTILIVEASTAVDWAAPGDIPYSDRVSPLTQIGRHLGPFTLCVMASAEARQIPSIEESKLRRAIGPANKDPGGGAW